MSRQPLSAVRRRGCLLDWQWQEWDGYIVGFGWPQGNGYIADGQSTNPPINKNPYLAPQNGATLSEHTATEQLKALFYRFQPMLVAYANRYLRSEEDAREAVQDVFLGVWNNRGHLQMDESLRSYLFTATRNKALNYLEKRKLEAVPLDAAFQQESHDPGVEEQLQAEETKAIIFDEVNRLPERCREVFLLSRNEGLSYREIAERLALSEKTVENQISIALKRLRARVYGEGGSGNGGGSHIAVLLALAVVGSAWGMVTLVRDYIFSKKPTSLWGQPLTIR